MTSKNEIAPGPGRWISASDGKELYWREWKAENPVAALLWLHGLGDHISRSDGAFTFLSKTHRISCYGFDQRGCGRTAMRSGKFGHSEGHEAVMNDITRAIEEVRKDVGSDMKLFLGGYSLGGMRLLSFAKERKSIAEKQLRGLISHAPSLKASPGSVPHPISVLALRGVNYFLPSLIISHSINLDLISRDKDYVQDLRNDPLCHPYVSLEAGRDAIDSGAELMNPSLTGPESFPKGLKMLFVHGECDKVTDPNATRDLVNRLKERGNVELMIVDGAFHCCQNEKASRDEVRQRWVDFMTNE